MYMPVYNLCVGCSEARVSSLLGLELEMAVRYHVGARDQNQALWKSTQRC